MRLNGCFNNERVEKLKTVRKLGYSVYVKFHTSNFLIVSNFHSFLDSGENMFSFSPLIPFMGRTTSVFTKDLFVSPTGK